MKRTFLLSLLLVLCSWGAARALAAADPGERFLDAYFMIQDGDAAEAKGDWQTADAKFTAALEVLREVKSQDPNWNSHIIEYRTKYCMGRLEALKSKLPSPLLPAQEAATVQPPVQESPVVVTPPSTVGPGAEPAPTAVEHDRIQQLTAELQQSREKLRQVEQDRDELKARLEEAIKKPVPSITAEAQEAQKQLRALEAVRDALTAKLQEAEAKAVQVETLKVNLHQAQERIHELEISRADLNAKLQEALSKTAGAQPTPQIEDLLKKNADLTAQLAAANNEIASLREQPGAPVSPALDQNQLRAELDETKRTLVVTTQELEAVRDENVKLKTSNEEILTQLTETERQLRAAKSSSEKNNQIIVELRKENAQLREASRPTPAVTAAEPEDGVTSSGLRTELRGWHPGRRMRSKVQATTPTTLKPESSTTALKESGSNKLVATINAPATTSATNAVAAQSVVEQQPAPAAPAGKPAAVRATPGQFGPAPAQIKKVDDKYRFVVIDFSSRVMPPVGTRMTVYRNGAPVGEVQLTEPARTQFATADILGGELQVGDEVR